MKQYSKTIKRTAWMLLVVLTAELVAPNMAHALTTGPSQPEVQGFEPVGTSDMVDMFGGDFVYNIPLMDVEGYPVNISYHGGVTMEQEASWVGLGWNINPGVVNRNVRGIPDDFNGDSVLKDFHIKDENNLRVGLGLNVAPEVGGFGDPSPIKLTLNAGGDVNISNYRGVSMDFNWGANVNVYKCASLGVNQGIGSQSGGTIDYNAGFSSAKFISKDMTGGDASIAVGGGYSTRSGIKDLSLSFSASSDNKGHSEYLGSACNIPIGMKNYVPVITNSSTMTTIHGRIKLGPEFTGTYIYGNISAMYNKVHFNNDASRSAYGYLYLQNANTDNTSILDFTRDKDGSFNKTMQYLPTPSMTYDVYSVSGQGTGGMFRPFRNDFGNVYDPYTTSSTRSEGGEGEIGGGNIFEAGFDYTHSETQITSGPWQNYQRSGTTKGFTSKKTGSIYENVYFKQAGELTEVDSNYYETIGRKNVIRPFDAMNLPQIKPGSAAKRDPRASLIYYHAAEEDTLAGVGSSKDIISYPQDFAGYSVPAVTKIKRIGTGRYQRKKHHVSEIVQVQKDGRKYVYGIPATNNFQREITFSVDDANTKDLERGTVSVADNDITPNNDKGRDNYYSSNITPSYTHSYLLTSVLSTDYVDVTGNGVSDDDLGTYTKFNYTRTDSDYRWVSPFSVDMRTGQYNPGFWSDKKDDKGSIVCGSREQWYLHSIETKNYIAEFYTSPREDAKGIMTKLLNASASEASPFHDAKSNASVSYKLDSIKLYNKHDRFRNTANAVPIKTVYFTYSYDLCSGSPNSTSGKLTLQKIFFKYGSSQKSMASPYIFSYDMNPAYNLAAKDRWGDFKINNAAFTNYEFPYTDQNANNDSLASAWSLTKIVLPSGGVIKATYESDDYAFVQDKPANEMFMVQGMGNSANYNGGSLLYSNLNSPNLYLYFKRRPSQESSSLTPIQNYLGRNFTPGGENIMYFNFNVNLTGDINTFEQIKGYANVQDAGICPNNSAYGYVRLSSKQPEGGGATLNPITYTAINTSRYNLPQIIYPGSDPDESDLTNILAGLKSAADELRNRFKSPVLSLAQLGYARTVNTGKSYIRLQSPGLCKKGGGQRVKTLTFSDQWNALSGGNSSNADYGKTYDYTVDDPTYGTISSGVASYEPMVGGDENPFRQPVKYTAQSGSSYPPNDPVDLYQEMPIGESLYPSASVGYSKVTVKSIHADIGKSSQGVDKYEFYTAKDFPVQVLASAKDPDPENHYDFFTQTNIYRVTQGYTLIFNDMHGKPKKVEHDVLNVTSNTLQPISYTIYNYRQNGKELDNNVPCLVNYGSSMVQRNRQLGVEEDVTLDSRQKNEVTTNTTVNGNLNIFMVGPFPIVLPVVYPWTLQCQNEFQSAVVAKVVQQYGIIDNVVSYNEGAVTTVKNEIYDPLTGQPIVTSVNNEYQDKEYTTNIPAYWVYKGMGASYNSIGYRDSGTITIGAHNVGSLHISNLSAPFVAGDELSVKYTDVGGIRRSTTAYVMGILPQYLVDSTRIITSHYDTTWHYGTHPITGPAYCFPETTFNVVKDDSTSHLCPDGSTFYEVIFYNALGAHSYLTFPATCIPVGHTMSVNVSYHLDYIYIWAGCNADLSDHCNYSETLNGTKYVNVDASGHFSDYVTTTSFDCFGVTSHNLPFSGTIPGSIVTTTVGTVPDTTYTLTTVYDTAYHYYTTPICNGISILPRFPQNTSGWLYGNTLTNVSVEVINSGQKNMLGESVENYTSMVSPVNSSNVLNTYLTNLISLKGRTYADSTTAIPNRFIANADTVNPFAIGERGLWRLLTEYSYLAPRNYTSVTARNSGLFNANNMFGPVTGLPGACYMNPFYYWMPNITDQNWHKVKTITKWSPSGKEIENLDAVGNYSTALFGYNESLPVAVGANMQQGDLYAEGFEDYNLLQYNNIVLNRFSPLNNFGVTALTPSTAYGPSIYNVYGGTSVTGLSLSVPGAHTGKHCLATPSGGDYLFTLPVNSNNYIGLVNNYNTYYTNNPVTPYHFTSANEFLPFKVIAGKEYILSYWIRQSGGSSTSGYSLSSSIGVKVGSTLYPAIKQTNIVDDWQLVEVKFKAGLTDNIVRLPGGTQIDDIRIYPSAGNMKSFVYDPFTFRLVATLDENNFATMYEYDQEGVLVRTKKETAKGIMTISESRKGNAKN